MDPPKIGSTIKASVTKANQYMSAVLKALRRISMSVRCWSLLLVTGSLKWYRETWSVAAKRTYDREQLVTNDEDETLYYNDQYVHFATFNFQKSACSSKAHSDISRNTVDAGC